MPDRGSTYNHIPLPVTSGGLTIQFTFQRCWNLTLTLTMTLTNLPDGLRLQVALLGADKPNGAEAHSSGELKLSSSQVALSYRATVATDAFIPRRRLHKRWLGLRGISPSGREVIVFSYRHRWFRTFALASIDSAKVRNPYPLLFWIWYATERKIK